MASVTRKVWLAVMARVFRLYIFATGVSIVPMVPTKDGAVRNARNAQAYITSSSSHTERSSLSTLTSIKRFFMNDDFIYNFIAIKIQYYGRIKYLNIEEFKSNVRRRTKND